MDTWDAAEIPATCHYGWYNSNKVPGKRWSVADRTKWKQCVAYHVPFPEINCSTAALAVLSKYRTVYSHVISGFGRVSPHPGKTPSRLLTSPKRTDKCRVLRLRSFSKLFGNFYLDDVCFERLTCCIWLIFYWNRNLWENFIIMKLRAQKQLSLIIQVFSE